MIWESWNAFLEMGGAAQFVWGSYGVTALLIVAELVLLRSRRVHSMRRLSRLIRAGQGRKLPEVQGS
ncbi:MAG: heme exporter protein CcmD [Rhodocyclaceae bacterium]|nr:heme exporter protein CcmD [Rhodocyclaceae bacterium]